MNEINPHQSNMQMGFGISELEMKHVKFSHEPIIPSQPQKERVKEPERHDIEKINNDLKGSQKSSLIKPVDNVYVIAAPPAEQSSKDEKSKHPYICMLHCLFKILSVFFYFVGKIMGLTPLSISLDIIIFSAFDFWCVKNLTGR